MDRRAFAGYGKVSRVNGTPVIDTLELKCRRTLQAITAEQAELWAMICRWCGERTVCDRYYCPRCGEVRCAVRRHGERLVKPHYKGPRHHIAGRQERDEERPQWCFGGPADEVEDRFH